MLPPVRVLSLSLGGGGAKGREGVRGGGGERNFFFRGQNSHQAEGRFRFCLRFLEKRFRRFQCPVPVRLLSHPEKITLLTYFLPTLIFFSGFWVSRSSWLLEGSWKRCFHHCFLQGKTRQAHSLQPPYIRREEKKDNQ